MQKNLLNFAFLLCLTSVSAQIEQPTHKSSQPAYQKNWNQIQGNSQYIDSICNELRSSRMNLNKQRMRTKEKSGFTQKGKQKTKLYNRNGQVYCKSTYSVRGEQKIKILTVNDKIVMTKFKYKWRKFEAIDGVFFTKRRIKFMATPDGTWLYTTKSRIKYTNEAEKIRRKRESDIEYVVLE